MTHAFVVTGTDTGIGKTVAAAALVAALDADYWKPVQSGLDGATDRDTVLDLAQIPVSRAHGEIYRLGTPVSPHRAAELDGIEIDTARLVPPRTSRLLVIEGAGGLLVPLTRTVLQIDVFARWGFPVVLVAPTRLGCINHALLSVEALKHRGLPLAGIIFMGDENRDSQRTILDFAGAPGLGRLPLLDPLDANSLSAAARLHLDLSPLDHWLVKETT